MKKYTQKNNITKCVYYFLLMIISIISTNCNTNYRDKTTESSIENKRINTIISGKWEQIKKIEVMNEDTLAQVNTYIFIDPNLSISKVENNEIVYTFMLSKVNEKTYSFDEGKHSVYLKNDSILSISYFNRDGKMEVYKINATDTHRN